MGRGSRIARAGALVAACVLLSTCGDDMPSSSPAEPGNDYSNRAGWEVTPDGVGPLELGWTAAEALESGLFDEPAPDADDPCPATTPELVGDYTDPDAGGEPALYVTWAFDPVTVAGFLLKTESDFRTPEGIGVGSTEAELQEAYGDRLETADFDWVNNEASRVPVVFGDDGGALVFTVRNGTIDAMQVLEGRRGETLVNSAPGGC